MRTLLRLICMAWIAAMLVSCSAPDGSPETDVAIKPGDSVAGALITAGTADQVASMWRNEMFRNCDDYRDGVLVCTVEVGSPMVLPWAVYDQAVDQGQPATMAGLDETWAGSTFDFTVNGRAIDLSAFGTVDFVHPMIGRDMRTWDLLITPSEPGETTFHNASTIGGDKEDEDVIIIAVPAA